MNDRWFYAKDKKKHGPVTREDLQALLARGELAPGDMVLQEGTTRWAPAGSVLPPAVPAETAASLFAEQEFARPAPPPVAPVAAVAEPPAPLPAPASPLPPAPNRAGGFGRSALGALAQVPRALGDAAAQTGRLVGYLGSRRRSARLTRHARRAAFALGLGLYRRKLGDPALLQQIAELEDRLRVLGEAGGSARDALRERDALLVKLARPWLVSASPPPNLQEEHERAALAERARAHYESAHARDRSTLYPASGAARARVLAGFALYLVLIGVGVFLLIPSAPPRRTGDDQVAKNEPPPVPPPEPVAKLDPSGKKTLKQLNAELSPAVPVVETLPIGGGSGFLVRHNGRYLVVTNRHVIEPARSGIEVHFLRTSKNKTEQRLVVPKDKAKVVAVHRVVDLALIDVSAMADQINQWHIRPVTLAARDYVPEQGEHVFAIGHPGDAAGGVLTRTLSDGIVSATNRTDRFAKGTFLQVTVAINPGNSGGPIFDDEGKVVGVATFMIRRSAKDLALEALNFGLETRYVHDLLEDPSQSLSEGEIAALFEKGKRPVEAPKELKAQVDAKLKGLLAAGYQPFTGDAGTSSRPFRLAGNETIYMPIRGLLRKDNVFVFVVSRGSDNVNLHVHDRDGKSVTQDVRTSPNPEVSFWTATGGDYRLVLDNRTANAAEGVIVLLLRGPAGP